MEPGIVYPHSAVVFAAVCATLLAVIGVFGNALTILALLKYAKTRGNVTTPFVISLSISDLLFCSFHLPLTSVRFYTERWIFGATFCKIFPITFYGNIGVSLLSMVAITINRYIYVTCQRLYNKIYSFKFIVLQLVFVWTLPFLFFLPVILELCGRTGLDEATFSCTILPKDGKSFKKALFLIAFLVPCIVIIISYAFIYMKVLRQRRRVQRHRSCQAIPKASFLSNRNSEESNRLTIMMAITFGGFLICFLPSVLAKIVDNENRRLSPWCHVTTWVMNWASNVVNPVLYAASNRNYRAAYFKVFNKLKFWGQPMFAEPLSKSSKGFSIYYKAVQAKDQEFEGSVFEVSEMCAV